MTLRDSTIPLRQRDQDPPILDSSLTRISELLESEHWPVQQESRGIEVHYIDAISAQSPSGFLGLGLKGMAMKGRLEIARDRDVLRVRYVPNAIGFLVTAALIAYAVDWLMADWVQYILSSPESAAWLQRSWWPTVIQCASGLLLAYPALRWRFTRMCRKALWLSEGAWQAYVRRARFWRRMGTSALVFGPHLLDAGRAWLETGGSTAGNGALAKMTLLLAAALVIDWDELVYGGRTLGIQRGRWAQSLD